jgi:hypothetical protein
MVRTASIPSLISWYAGTGVSRFWLGVATNANAVSCFLTITTTEANTSTTTTFDDAMAEYDRKPTDILSTPVTASSSGYDFASYSNACVSGLVCQIRPFRTQDFVGR